MSASQPSLFDDGAQPDDERVRPARVEFLAGMLATWALGTGSRPSAVQLDGFTRAAREALSRAVGLAGRAADQSMGNP